MIDESLLLPKVGSREVMYGQLRHLAETAELPNVELRILPLQSGTSLMADSFVVFGFSPEHETSKLSDVVSTEVAGGNFISKERPIRILSASSSARSPRRRYHLMSLES